MKNTNNIKSFREFNENLNISDISSQTHYFIYWNTSSGKGVYFVQLYNVKGNLIGLKK